MGCWPGSKAWWDAGPGDRDAGEAVCVLHRAEARAQLSWHLSGDTDSQRPSLAGRPNVGECHTLSRSWERAAGDHVPHGGVFAQAYSPSRACR